MNCPHLFQKGFKERTRRLKFFIVGLDLIRNNRNQPTTTMNNPQNKNEILYRFTGITCKKEIFFVQIKQNKKRKNAPLHLLSIFPK